MKKIILSISFLIPLFVFAQETRVLNGQYNDGKTFGKPIPDTVRTLVANSPLSIVSGGSSLVDTIKSSGGIGGTPAGSTGYIQYNNSGSFGASSNLFWDNTNGRLGLWTTSPAFDVELNKSTNSAIRIAITNDNIGTAAQSLFQTSNGTGFIQLGTTGTGFATSGLLTANTVFFQSNAGSRLVFKAITAAGKPLVPIIFGVGDGNTEAMRIFGNGTVSIGGDGTDSTSKLVVNGNINSIQNYVGGAISTFTNSNSGTLSLSRITLSNGTESALFQIAGTGYTTSGLTTTASTMFANNGGSRLLIKSIQSATYTAPPIIFGLGTNGNTEAWRIDWTNGNLSNTGSDGTAYINLKAGTATVGTAPLKFTSGTNLTTAEAGAMEYNGTNLFFTPSSAVRNSILMSASVNTVSPTAPNRTITVVINGTTYYIAAKTTND